MGEPEWVLYDNSVKFSYADKGHKYTVSKKLGEVWLTPTPVTGITTITSIINKDALVYWSAKIAAYHMRDNYKEGVSLVALAEEAKVAHKTESRKGASVGTVGHKLIESLLLGKPVKMPEKPELKEAVVNIRAQHEAFERDFAPETIHVEQPMYSLRYDFAGTDDRFCTINGKRIVIDYKSTNRSYFNPDGIYASNFAQLGGQILLIEEQLKEEVDDAMIVNFAKDSQEYKLRSLSDLGLTTHDAKLYFLHCLDLYNINKLFEWRLNK